MSADVRPQRRFTAESFVAWAGGREGRYELFNGEVVAQASELVAHARTKFAVSLALHEAIKNAGAPCHFLPDGVAVKIGSATVYEPDALVYCGPELPGSALLVEKPILVVEVLSPSTGSSDKSRKLIGYFGLPSVIHYLIVDPEEPHVIHHQRVAGGEIRTRILNGGVIRLDPPGLEIAFRQIYPSLA